MEKIKNIKPIPPINMSRVLVETMDGQFDFAYYKDGMYQNSQSFEWKRPEEIRNYWTIGELKMVFNKPN